jgi:WD40 repeat protein
MMTRDGRFWGKRGKGRKGKKDRPVISHFSLLPFFQQLAAPLSEEDVVWTTVMRNGLGRSTFKVVCITALALCAAGCPDRAAPPPSPPPRPDTREAAHDEASRGLRPLSPLSAASDYRARWAVIVGIDDYPGGESGLKPLQYAVNDARELHELLRTEFGYREPHVRYLTDGRATLPAIREAFESWLPSRDVDQADSLLVFFAGHGLVDPDTNRGYLAAIDSRTSALAQSCLAVAWLKERLARLPCRHKLVVLDACYSGSLFQRVRQSQPGPGEPAIVGAPGTRGPGGPPADDPTRGLGGAAGGDNLAYYLNRPAFLGISAGRLTPVADGSGAERHSVFTAALLDVLRERADSPREDHAFTFRQVAAEVESRVANALGSHQIPDWGRLDEGDGDFVFRPVLRRLTPREIAQRETYAKQIAQALDHWRNGDVARAKEILDQCPEGLRHWEWRYLSRLCRQERLSLREGASTVNAVALSPDGRWIAAATGRTAEPGQVFVWDAQTGDRAHTFRSHLARASAVALSPDSKRLLSAGWEGALALWQLDKGQQRWKIATGEGPVHAAVFDPVGRRVISAGEDGIVRLCDAADGRLLESLDKHEGPVRGLAVAAEAKRLISGGDDGTVLVWDLAQADAEDSTANETEPTVLSGHQDAVIGVATSRDGKYTVSIDRSGTLICWDMPAGKPRSRRQLDGASAVAVAPDAARVAVACRDQLVRLLDPASGEVVATLRGHDAPVTAAAFGAQGKLCSGDEAGTVKLWDLGDREAGALVFRGHQGWVNDVAFGPEGRLAASAGEDGRVLVWDYSTLDVVRELPGHEVAARCVAFGPGGRLLASGGADCTVKLWDLAEGAEPRTLDGCGGTVNCVAFTSDGTQVLAGSVDKTVRAWKLAPGEPGRVFSEHTHSVNGLAIRPGDGLVFSGAGSKFARTAPEWLLWDAASGETRFSLALAGDTGTVHDVAASPDGRWLASAGPDAELRVWDARYDPPRLCLQNKGDHPQRDAVTAVAFSPDGARLAAVRGARTVVLWDPLAGLPVLTLHRFDAPVTALCFSPDGNQLAAASWDKTVRVWDAAVLP